MDYFNDKLNQIKKEGIYRTLKTVEEYDGRIIKFDNKQYINFGSNNYFNISSHPKVIEVGKQALEEFGGNICSAQTLCGFTYHHKNLSEKLKEVLKAEEVALFSSGYLANLAIFQIFPKEECEIFMDIYSHRSLIDAARLSGIKLYFYKHLNYNQLETLLSRSNAKYKVIATDSVFSMEATLVNLKQLLKIKEEFNAFLLIDDAHGFIVLKNSIFDYFTNLIYIATMSKALGNLGGFVASTKVIIDILRSKASTFLFDTALPPNIAAMSYQALEILLKETEYITKLANNIHLLNRLLNFNQVIPIFIKKFPTIEQLNRVFQKLLEDGIYVPAIRYPTVPKDESRLRISLTASHTQKDLEKLATLLLSL
jgi:8-amino-7-oxononanoate synthase